jgi:hypothetical protein
MAPFLGLLERVKNDKQGQHSRARVWQVIGQEVNQSIEFLFVRHA